MPAFMKLGDIKGEATDQNHKDWIIVQNMDSSIMRTIPEGAKDHQRSRGDTCLADLVVVRELDKSSMKLQEACANGTFFPEVTIHFCTTVKNRQEPYLKYVLKDVIVSGFSMSAHHNGDPLPVETVQLSYTEVLWTYVRVDPKTGQPTGHVPCGYNPGTSKSTAA